jgi:hypothetical protein
LVKKFHTLVRYKWLVKDAHVGNVKRALASSKWGRAAFNGHSHRGGNNKGQQYEELLCRNVTQWFENFDVAEVTRDTIFWELQTIFSMPSQFHSSLIPQYNINAVSFLKHSVHFYSSD